MATATMTYRYSVRDRSGKMVTGTIDADSPTAVASKLKSMGYAPVSIAAQKTGGMSMEIKLPKLGADREAQGPGDLLAPVRDDDQLGPLAAAGA